jgi:DNA-binding protein YbaB
MGIIDSGKMLMKARKAQAQMKQTQAAGSSKSAKTAVLINGLGEIEEIEFNFPEEIVELVGEAFFKDLTKEVIQAYNAAKKELESKLAQNMDMDSIKDMLGV